MTTLLERRRLRRLEPAAPEPAAERPLALEVVDVHKHFRKRVGFTTETFRAVAGVSLTVEPGETVGLVGESGCGKSTLVRTILGLHEPTSGTIRVMGADVNAYGSRERAKARSNAQVVFQDPYSSLDPRMSAKNIVAEPLRLHRQYSEERVKELFDWVGLPWEYASRKAAAFSGGQRQRIGIARALALRPRLVILDEPVSALDVSIQAQIINLLAELQRELGVSYLFVAHDLSVVRHVSHRVAVMRQGRIVEQGPTEEIFLAPENDYTRTLLSAIPIPDPRRRPS
ncbi:ATP-binding cassette domain-containing protein [Microbacterium sp. NPDC056057]|uniref:ATP-binding cassette domain-containing protein n=1 Tax=Microbacterium sp. NPDC056057 TaxID=3345699 RepID=UPI0035DA7F32